MPQGEHSAALSTFIKLTFVFKSLFCLFLSVRLRQVSIMMAINKTTIIIVKSLGVFKCKRAPQVKPEQYLEQKSSIWAGLA